MASVNILHNTDSGKYYIGSCLDLVSRLEQHKNRTFKVCYTSVGNRELFLDISELEYKWARSIEAHIKRMKSRTYILNLSRYPEMRTKLKELYK